MNETIQSGTVGTLLEILATLPDDMILSDGGTNWSVECLADAIRDANRSDPDIADHGDYVVGFTSDGRVTIRGPLDLEPSVPAYTQKAED